MEYKNHTVKPADNFGKDYLIYSNNRFIKSTNSIEQAKSFIDKTIKDQFEIDYSQTFKYERGSDDSNWLIYTGRQNGDKFYLMTPSIAFFNFETEAEAKKFCEQLNKIADKTNHSNKHNY